MASQFSQQYAFRAQKHLGLVSGSADYVALPSFMDPGVPARTFRYSSDGRFFAYALPTFVKIFEAESARLLQELSVNNATELNFSPRGTYISTWERPAKLGDGAQHKNLRVFSVSTGEELIAFTQKSQEGWDLQYTLSESHAVRLVAQEVQVYRPAEWNKGVVDKLKVEGASMVWVSPGLNPSIAVFVAEKKGSPASIKIYSVVALSSLPTCSKAFYKADRAQIKWNDLGTQALVLTQTEVDNSNKSYYGETSLYLLSTAGNFDCRVTLDKEGPIHDVAWSPNGKEFGVVYGYMPAKTMIFDSRVRTLYDFGSSPVNTISFNPQGRLLLLAGFGNLAGKIDVFDRRTLAKIATIDSPNTSYCAWSPCGRFLLNATLSPRLRVDNGIKIWYCTGSLMHVQAFEELYQADWRPTPVDQTPAFGPTIPPAPQPSESVRATTISVKPPAAKPGAYRPPGARGLETPKIFKREDEGGVPTGNNLYGQGSKLPPQNEVLKNGRRHVPGASSGKGETFGLDKRRKEGKKQKAREGSNAAPPIEGSPRPSVDVHANGVEKLSVQSVALSQGPIPSAQPEQLDPVAKKVRNLNKKLKAIEELKEKAKRGERLEATQLKKIEGEVDIRTELASITGVA